MKWLLIGNRKSAIELAASPGFAPGPSGSKPGMLRLHHEAMNWWPAGVTLPVQRIKSPLHHFNACRPKSFTEPKLGAKAGARGRTCTCTVDVLDVVPRHWATRAKWMGPPAGVAPTSFLYKRNPQAAAERQKWSQSPVPPRARLAYDACLNAGSTAVLAHGNHSKTGAPTRSCTELTRLPSEDIAEYALGAQKLVSLTGFAPVISCMRGRRVGWTTPQGQKMVRASGNAPEPGTHLVRHGL